MGVESSVSESMDNLNNIPMLDTINGFLHSKILPVGSLDNPPIVDILECIAGYLLLVAGPPTITVPDRVDVLMTV